MLWGPRVSVLGLLQTAGQVSNLPPLDTCSTAHSLFYVICGRQSRESWALLPGFAAASSRRAAVLCLCQLLGRLVPGCTWQALTFIFFLQRPRSRGLTQMTWMSWSSWTTEQNVRICSSESKFWFNVDGKWMGKFLSFLQSSRRCLVLL